MALIIQTSVYAIERTMYTPPISMGIKSASIKQVLPVRDANGKWIGTNDLPATQRASIYSQLKVEKDESGTSIENYYLNRSVASVVAAMNA